MNEHKKETQISIIITKDTITDSYIALQPMTYDFYLLYLLYTAHITPTATHSKKNAGINFCQSSSIPCLTTSQLFINKNNGYIELFSIYDLTTNIDNLCLPKAPKFIMTTKNFMDFMVQKAQIEIEQPDQFFIVIDEQGHAHITTDLHFLVKTSFLASLQKKIAGLFTRPAK